MMAVDLNKIGEEMVEDSELYLHVFTKEFQEKWPLNGHFSFNFLVKSLNLKPISTLAFWMQAMSKPSMWAICGWGKKGLAFRSYMFIYTAHPPYIGILIRQLLGLSSKLASDLSAVKCFQVHDH